MLHWLRAGVDPTTGDKLTAGEMASRLVQRIIRRWLFLGTITTITAYLWIIRDPIWHHSPADTWNYILSWLAIAIESVVGMFFFGQSMRDAVVIRAILKELVERVERMERENGEMLRAVHAKVCTPPIARDPATGRFVKRERSEEQTA